MLKGYSYPKSPKGTANLVPAPPWHYTGTILAVEFEADPSKIEAYLPQGLTYENNRCCMYFIDWQFASEDGEEFLNPIESQYKETILLMTANHKGEAVPYCPYIWVDQDKAFLRGMIQGWPKQNGQTHMTKPFGLVSKAAPKNTHAATLSVNGFRYMNARVDLKEDIQVMPNPSFAGTMLRRYFPDLVLGNHDKPLVDDITQLISRDVEIGPIKRGDATLTFSVGEDNEVSDFTPTKVLSGFLFEASMTVEDLGIVK